MLLFSIMSESNFPFDRKIGKQYCGRSAFKPSTINIKMSISKKIEFPDAHHHWNVRTPDALLHQRRANLLASVRAEGLEAIIVFGHGSVMGAGTKSHGALRYLSDWDGYESSSLLIVTPTQTQLLVGSPFMLPMAQQQRGQDTHVLYLKESLWGNYLRQQFPAQTRFGEIGLDEAPMRIGQAIDSLSPHFTLVSVVSHLNTLRMFKDRFQLTLHAQAGALCDLLFSRLPLALASGQPVWKIKESLESFARSQGADYCKTWLTVAACADYPRYWPYEGQHVPERGDQVIFGIMLTIHGHWGHGIRMGALGKVQHRHHEMWEVIAAMMHSGIAALRVGEVLSRAEDDMDKVFSVHFGAYETGLISHFRNGHGLGFSYEEPLSTDYFPQHFGNVDTARPAGSLTVAPDMLFELHPNVFIKDVGGCAIGEMVVTSHHGPQVLLTSPREILDWS